MIAANGQTLVVGVYNCRLSEECTKYNPADKLPAVLTIKGIRVGAREKANICTHGGGSGCEEWRRIIDNRIATQGGFR